MRWTYTVFSIVGWLSVGIFWNFFRNAYRVLASDSFSIVTIGVNSIIGIAIVVLLNTHVSREWFRVRAAEA